MIVQDDKQRILVALMKINADNGGNRMTEAMANGISVCMGQFLDSLIAEAENAQQAPEGAKE